MNILVDLVVKKQWDKIEQSKKCPILFVVLKVLPDEKVELSLFQFAWLDLFSKRVSVKPVCLTPIFRLMASGDSVRLFEVPLDAFIEGKCGPIDAVVGLIQDSLGGDRVRLEVKVGDDDKRNFVSDKFLAVQPLWRDTLVPIMNRAFSLQLAMISGCATDALLLCAIFDPWFKHNIVMAPSFRLPDDNVFPKGKALGRQFELPDIEACQRMSQEMQRCQARNLAFSQELMQVVWHPSKVAALGGFIDEF